MRPSTPQITPLRASALAFLVAGVAAACGLAGPSGEPSDPQCEVETPDYFCNADDLEHLYMVDACGNTVAEKRCASKQSCEEDAKGQASCRCTLTGNLSCRASTSQFATALYDDTYVVKERECVESSRAIDPADPDIVETCGFGQVCYVDDYEGAPGMSHEQRHGGQAFCARSMTDEQSPYYDYGCDRAFTEFIRYPTALEVDCRCRLRGVSGSQEQGGNGSLPADPANPDPNATPPGHPRGSIMNCAQPGRVDAHKWPVAYGSGPVLSDYNKGASTWYGAELDPQSRELFAVINWGNSQYTNTASIVAWDVDSGDRRIVSGLLPNSLAGEESYGSGHLSPTKFLVDARGETQPLTDVDALRLASDGNLYASSASEIVRVDPETGERALVWRRQIETITGDITATYGQCFRPDHLGREDGLQLQITSFEVGPDLEFYKGFNDVRGGNGILKISPDGKTCTIITLYNAKGDPDPSGDDDVPAAPDIGAGFLPPTINAQIYGMLFHAGKLYAVMSGALVEVDPASGDRRRVDDPEITHSAGYTAMHWDPNRDVIWTSGSTAAIFGNTVIDPITGQKEQIVTDSGRKNYPGRAILDSVLPGGGSAANTGGGATSNNNPTQLGGVVVDPIDPDIAYGVTTTGALIKLELSTFNNYIHSWGQH